ncbi:hypothetical protein [Natronorubrum aibiense]|uniref:Uncharacterized protein n=1 Tax=Natronorubrum aibiense TaxID=348826 RepID=A0A5P9P904_9EURY|nr:hypothetical protein [Natronorubrum aibiense]QFU84619.1 hypothetical protein GCU68_18970 [Natronorubrum aibiense]
MQYDEIDLQVRERDGERRLEVDGYFRPHPESKPPEYRRHAIFDLTEQQARKLYDDLGEQLDAWD